MVLRAVVNHPKLERLFLNQNDINLQAGDALAEFLMNCKNLKEIRLSNNMIEDSGGIKIVNALIKNTKSTVRGVHLSNNKLSMDVADKFAKLIEN